MQLIWTVQFLFLLILLSSLREQHPLWITAILVKQIMNKWQKFLPNIPYRGRPQKECSGSGYTFKSWYICFFCTAMINYIVLNYIFKKGVLQTQGKNNYYLFSVINFSHLENSSNWGITINKSKCTVF